MIGNDGKSKKDKENKALGKTIKDAGCPRCIGAEWILFQRYVAREQSLDRFSWDLK